MAAKSRGNGAIKTAGTLIYIPANAPHTLVSTPDEDVIFIAIKDLAQGIIGQAVDGTMAGPHYLKGFESKAAKKKTARRVDSKTIGGFRYFRENS